MAKSLTPLQVAVGTGKFEKGQTIPLAVKAGDHVLFGKYAGTEIKLDAEELLIVREEEILGILNGVGSQIKAVKK